MTDDRRRGAQIFATDLAPALTRCGAVVRTYALASETEDGLEIPALGPTRRHPKTWRAVRLLARDADVVIAHGSTTLTIGVLATIGTGTPVVYRQISDSQFWAGDRLRRARVRVLLRRAARVVALADQAKSVLVRHFGLPPDRVDVVPNGVPGRDLRPPTADQRRAARDALEIDDRFCVLSLSALVPEKGIDVAISAASACQTPVILLIAGDGPARDELEQLAEATSSEVRFLGSLSSPVDALHAADALILASKGGDSMPAALIEAAMTGVPVVTTPVGAIPEMVSNNQNGILLPSADATLAASAIDRLAINHPLRADIISQALLDARRYDIDVVAAAWLTTCESARSSVGRKRLLRSFA